MRPTLASINWLPTYAIGAEPASDMSGGTQPGLCYLCVCVGVFSLPTVYFMLWTPARMKLINRKLSVWDGGRWEGGLEGRRERRKEGRGGEIDSG